MDNQGGTAESLSSLLGERDFYFGSGAGEAMAAVKEVIRKLRPKWQGVLNRIDEIVPPTIKQPRVAPRRIRGSFGRPDRRIR